MGSLPAEPHNELKPKILSSNVGRELERLKRGLVLDLFLRRGPFWDAVFDVRTRWQFEAITEVPPLDFDDSIYPIPEATEWKNDQWVQWDKDRKYLRNRALPQVYSRPISDKFFEACVVYDPPDTALLRYAERFPLGATLLINDGVRAGLTKDEVLSMPHMIASAIKRICDPDQLLDIQMEFINKLLEEVNERHLKPRGLSLDSMIEDVLQTTSLLRERLQKESQLRLQARLYVAPESHHTTADLKEAIRMITAAQPQRPRGGRPPIDELVAVHCALLHGKYNENDPSDRRFWRWTYKSLHKEFEEYGVDDERSAEEHLKRGRELLVAWRKNLQES